MQLVQLESMEQRMDQVGVLSLMEQQSLAEEPLYLWPQEQLLG